MYILDLEIRLDASQRVLPFGTQQGDLVANLQSKLVPENGRPAEGSVISELLGGVHSSEHSIERYYYWDRYFVLYIYLF